MNANCSLGEKCLTCFQPNPKKCPKTQPYNKFSKYFLLSIMLTDQCNRSCSHCWQKNLKYGTFTKESITKVLTFLRETYPKYSFPIAILGGEPGLYPDLLEHIIKTQLELYQVGSLRIYTNGDNNISKLYDISEKYQNVTYQVSKNYSIIQYKNFKKYIETASVVYTESTSNDYVINLIKNIKEMGYSNVIINFDILDQQPKDKIAYFNKGVSLLKSLAEFNDDTFEIINLNERLGSEFSIQDIESLPLPIQLFPDEKFYLTHYKASEPIGDLISGIDIDKMKSLYLNNPCLTCNNQRICGFYHMPQFVEQDLTQHRYDMVCLGNLISATAARWFRGEYNINETI